MRRKHARILVAQMGARMHYGVPRILEERGRLEALHVDLVGPALLDVPFVPAAIRRLAGRSPGIRARRLHVHWGLGIKYAARRWISKSDATATAAHLWAGGSLCRRVLRRGLGASAAIYAYNSAALELLESARHAGLMTILEQTIAPRQVEERILNEERRAFPSWADPDAADPFTLAFDLRERSEWERADLIICGSEFVKDGIASCDGPVERCVVIPYGIRVPNRCPQRDSHAGPLRILVVGAVGLRKGSPYVGIAAQMLGSRAHVRMVGPIESCKAGESLRRVELVGPCPRSEMPSHYRWADVFLLPSLCEGSATAVYEALAAGLPVICTHNTGSVIMNGSEGFIVPVRDVNSIVRSIEILCDQRLRKEMGHAAWETARQYSSLNYGKRLIAVIDEALAVHQRRRKTLGV